MFDKHPPSKPQNAIDSIFSGFTLIFFTIATLVIAIVAILAELVNFLIWAVCRVQAKIFGFWKKNKDNKK